MGLVERITATHVAVDKGLARLDRMVADLDGEQFEPELRASIRESMESIRRRLERHIGNDLAIGDRSEEILGPGMLAEYRITSHHDALRASVDTMLEALENGDASTFTLEYDRFLALFDDYSECERQFLSTNAGVLYPGGATA